MISRNARSSDPRRVLARHGACVAALAVALGVVSACGSGGSSSTAPAAKAPALFAELPAGIKASKQIRIATEVGYAPYEVYAADGHTLQGLDVDLWMALGRVLGLAVKPQDGTYANIVPAIEAKRADLGWSAMLLASFSELTQAKFVVYQNRSFSGLVVASGNESIKSGASPCGKTLGWTNGEADAPISASQAECKKEGKPPIATKRFNKTSDILLAVESGQVDGRLADSVNGNYFVKQSMGKLKFVDDVFPRHEIPTGIAISAEDPQLISVVQRGLQRLVDDGTYAQILNKWGAADTAVPSISVVYKYAG